MNLKKRMKNEFSEKNLGVVKDEHMKNRRKINSPNKSIFKDTFAVPEVEGSKNFVTLKKC